MLIYAPYSTNTDISFRQPTIDFLKSYMLNNKSDILLSKDCTEADYLYEQYFMGIVKEYPNTDMIIVEQDTVPTDNIMAGLKSADYDLVENAYQSISDRLFNERLAKLKESVGNRINRVINEKNDCVIYAFGLCKIKSNILNKYIADKEYGIIPDKIGWMQFYDLFYAWYNGISYGKLKFENKGFQEIHRLNNEVGKHNK